MITDFAAKESGFCEFFLNRRTIGNFFVGGTGTQPFFASALARNFSAMMRKRSCVP